MKKQNRKKVELLKLIPYYSKYKKTLILTIFLSLLYTGASVIVPIVEGNLISSFNTNILDNIRYVGILVIGLLLSKLMCSVFIHFWSVAVLKLNSDVNFDLKSSCLENVLQLENKNFDNTGTGVFISRVYNDTLELSELVDYVIDDASIVITNIAFLIYAYIISAPLGIFLTFLIIITSLITNAKLKRYKLNSFDFKMKDEKVVGIYTDIIKGVKDVKNLDLEKSLLPKTKLYQRDAINADKKKKHSRRTWSVIYQMVISILEALFVVLAVYLISKNQLEIGSFVVIYIYKGKIVNMLDAILRIREKLAEGEVASKRVFEVIESTMFSKEKYGDKKIEKINGVIAFENVVFNYDEYNKLFKNLSFEIEPNTMVAFVGKSGEGKSTILDLIAKNYDVNGGKVLLDNNNIKELSKDTIKKNISIVTQEPYIFNMSFKENIKIANPLATDEEIIEVCKKTSIDEVVSKKKNGYDTIVGESGITLSGGQKQRLAIARALIKKSKIILFDEATSALDNHSQEEIKNLIKELSVDHTIIIVAHRLSTIVDADKIFVVSNHQIQESGTHEELLYNSDIYSTLYQNEWDDMTTVS